jgi:hypothetical protein
MAVLVNGRLGVICGDGMSIISTHTFSSLSFLLEDWVKIRRLRRAAVLDMSVDAFSAPMCAVCGRRS